MVDREEIERKFAAGLKVAEAESRRLQAKLSDPALSRAFELRERAWEIAVSPRGNRQEALTLIKEAADLDSEYAPQIAAIQDFFERRDRSGKVSVSKAINRVLTPQLLARGFQIGSGRGEASVRRRGHTFIRVRDDLAEQVSISPSKFGKRLELLVSREVSPGLWEHRDGRGFGCAHEALAYLNQKELEDVVVRLTQLLETEVLPWLESK